MSRRFNRNKIVWMSQQVWPAAVGFCPSEKAWRAFLKEWRIDDPNPYPTSAGHTIWYQREGDDIILVFIDDRVDQRDDFAAVVALMAHEVMHVVQHVSAAMKVREGEPEFQAYSMQHILGHLLMAYQGSRRPRALRGKT